MGRQGGGGGTEGGRATARAQAGAGTLLAALNIPPHQRSNPHPTHLLVHCHQGGGGRLAHEARQVLRAVLDGGQVVAGVLGQRVAVGVGRADSLLGHVERRGSNLGVGELQSMGDGGGDRRGEG